MLLKYHILKLNEVRLVSNGENKYVITYDNEDDSLWLTVNNLIKHIDKKGKLLSTLELGVFQDIKQMKFIYLYR